MPRTALAVLSTALLLAASARVHARGITEMPLVLQHPEMDSVGVRSLTYKTVNDTALRIDLYYPPGLEENARAPAVVFNNGVGSMTLPQWRGYRDFAKLTALRGLVAVHYQSRRSRAREDTEDLFDFLLRRAGNLGIDATRLGMFTSSANVRVGLPLAMQAGRDYLRCVAVYYGMTDVEPARQDLPILIVRAGLDSYALNRSIDEFIATALDHDLNIELINYLHGVHAFEVLDDTGRSRDVIRRTLDFFEFHLANPRPDADPFILTGRNFYTMVVSGELDRAKRMYRETRKRWENDPALNPLYNRAAGERSLNQVGYRLLEEGMEDEAIAVFRLVLDTFPESPNAYDSMADAFEAVGETGLAVEFAGKALEKLETDKDLPEFRKQAIRRSAEDKLRRLKGGQ